MPTPQFRLRPSTWWFLIKVSVPFALIQLTLTFNFQIDTIILQNFQSYQVIGWYNASYQFARSLLTITSALIIALPLTMAREHERDPKVVSLWYFRSVKFMVFIGLPLAIGGALLADKIVPLVYGKSFLPASLLFAILIWDIPLLMYTALSGNITTAIKREKTAMFIYLMVGGFNTVTNLMLQPRYGVIAASVITVGSETVGAALFYILFRREFGTGLSLKHLLRLALAALVMGAAILLLRNLPLIIPVTVGTVIYLACVYITGALTLEERQTLAGFAMRKLGRFLPMRLRATQT
jgi:O-antigen/teichoic acid export membrane protein